MQLKSAGKCCSVCNVKKIAVVKLKAEVDESVSLCRKKENRMVFNTSNLFLMSDNGCHCNKVQIFLVHTIPWKINGAIFVS